MVKKLPFPNFIPISVWKKIETSFREEVVDGRILFPKEANYVALLMTWGCTVSVSGKISYYLSMEHAFNLQAQEDLDQQLQTKTFDKLKKVVLLFDIPNCDLIDKYGMEIVA